MTCLCDFSLQLSSFKNKRNFFRFVFFRGRLCIVQSWDILMRRLFASPPKSRHALVEGEALIVGLLGGLTDQAAHGHWQQKSEAGVRETSPRLLPPTESWRASSADSPRAIHPIEIRATRVRQLTTNAELHARPNGELSDEEGQGGQQIPSEKVRSQRGRRHAQVLREGGEESESHSAHFGNQRRVRATIQERNGAQKLPPTHLSQPGEFHSTHLRVPRRRRNHRQLVSGDPMRQASLPTDRLSERQRVRIGADADEGLRQGRIFIENGAAADRRIPKALVHVGLPQADVSQ